MELLRTVTDAHRACYGMRGSGYTAEVHPPAVAMVMTKVTPILFSGECYMGNCDMKVGAIDPYHRELQVNMS